LLALAGVAVISEASFGNGMPTLALLAILGAVVCFAEAAVLIRRLPPVHPVTMNAVGMTTGAAFLLAASLVAGEAWQVPQRAATWLSLGYLVVFGSVAVFVLFLVVLKYWAASRAAYVFVISPIVAVVLSAWLDNEPIHAGLVLGGLLILAGVYVGALRPATRQPAAPATSETKP
jgi:drug/metabolite transporter (DMT)-like permease